MRDVRLIVIHCSASRNGAVLTVDQYLTPQSACRLPNKFKEKP